MNEKKYIFCISASDDFAVAAAVLIYSIKRNVKIAGECDFVVPYNNLSQEAMKIGEKLYQQEQEGNAENNETGASNDDSKEDVVDADYEEVKEDKEEASN